MHPDEGYPTIPEDSDAEQVLIDAICAMPDHPEIPDVLRIVNGGECFLMPQCRFTYLAFKVLHEHGEEINSLTLKTELEVQGHIGWVGGYVGLTELLSYHQLVETIHPIRVAEHLADLHRRRQLQKLAGRLMQESSDPTIPLQELLEPLRHLAIPEVGRLLTILDASEFLDHEAPASRWLIPGVVPLAVPAVMASKGGVGKSFLALQMCIALATGKGFLACEPQEPIGAVYFGLEDDKDTFHRRVKSIVEHYKACDDWTEADDANLRQNFRVPFINWKAKGANGFLPTVAPELTEALQTLVNHGVRPGVVIIDTLARVSEGDENTVQALRPILNALNLIVEFGWTPLVLHHVAKGQDGARGDAKKKPLLADRMSTEWVRGSSAIVDNFRCVLQLTLINADEAAGAGLDEDKARMGGYAVFGATKLNSGQKSDWLFVEQDEHGRWFTPKDGIETLARIRGTRAVAALTQQLEILVAIHAQRFNKELDHQALADRFWPNKPTAKNCLKTTLNKLRNNGLLQKKGFFVTSIGLERVGLLPKVTKSGGDSE